VSFSERSHGVDTKTREREIEQAEFSALLEATKALPMKIAPDEGANHILQALAEHFGVANSENSWREATKVYRQILVHHIRALQHHAPPWLIGSPARPSPLLIGDCVPTYESLHKLGMGGVMLTLPKLSGVISAVRGDLEAVEQNKEERHRYYRAQII
jgi:hypothetical protein